MPQNWIITGASRGLGRASTEAVLNAGHSVAAITRRAEAMTDLADSVGDRLLVLPVERIDRRHAAMAVQAAVEAFGTIDVVVNNAAHAVFSPAEDMTEDDLREQLEVTFFSAVHLTNAVIPIFRAQISGRVLQITSISTRRPGAGLAGYSAAKWALTGFSFALAQEVAPFGVKVTLVEPGGMRTAMVDEGRARSIRPEYESTVGEEGVRLLQRRGREPIDPAKVAEVLLALAGEEKPPLRLVVGGDALTVASVMNQRQAESDEAWAEVSRSVDYPRE